MKSRAPYGKGKAKTTVATRLDDEDMEFLSTLHESRSEALRLALHRYRAMCRLCRDSLTNSLDQAESSG